MGVAVERSSSSQHQRYRFQSPPTIELSQKRHATHHATLALFHAQGPQRKGFSRFLGRLQVSSRLMLAFVGISLSTASLAKIRSDCCSAAFAFKQDESQEARRNVSNILLDLQPLRNLGLSYVTSLTEIQALMFATS